MMRAPQPEEQEPPYFVLDDADTSDSEVPMFVSLRWDGDGDGPAAIAGAGGDATQTGHQQRIKTGGYSPERYLI